MNCILQVRRPTQKERDYAACPESQGDSMEELRVTQSLSPTARHFHQVQSCMYFNFFFLILIWLKKERLSKTWINYCIFNSTWTCEKPCSIHCKQSGRWFSKSYETHVRESASWKISERMDRATILHVSSQIHVRVSDKTTVKENQTGQKTVQLKRKFPFIHTICLNETNKKLEIVVAVWKHCWWGKRIKVHC